MSSNKITISDYYYKKAEIDTMMNGKANSSHTHNTWTKKKLWTDGDNNATLWVNEDIRLCHLKYYQKNVSVSSSEKKLHTGLIPISYRPLYTIISGCYNPHVSVAVIQDGSIFCLSDESTTRTVNGSLMWHY